MPVVVAEDPRDFFVWVPPENPLVQHNLVRVGCFIGGPLDPADDDPSKLPYQPNPIKHEIMLTPFHTNVMKHYAIEYELDVHRWHRDRNLPSRLHALYLLNSEYDAEQYARSHPEHVRGRILKVGRTAGKYRFSLHDTSWIDFLRLDHSLDRETFGSICDHYWSGTTVANRKLQSRGQPWTAEPSLEVLFYGQIDFPDRKL
ncbi:hypothetical protein [Phyllobacterium endophyticum]|uniref:Uncharacterized protein n=1 Tax=Phyllobacterium endophyticum TaxID=1149773 RepID=A0A2P7AUS1_9HYPH|nr:hypothetical protein [Phyllobacterium endophyticum]MBB3234467.1 hypothetical protein [Phyllobacterium endophyticum]PSH57972.1 hypothetical protein CU100_09860 [Phyllobacterium endophyticum]TYR39510.1 hypothetical protein FY050_20690 [Phyllobacterium endophyticum]